ncbi:hypothetical protein MTO96_025557 [Rhipicephalus appendiculatus]
MELVESYSEDDGYDELVRWLMTPYSKWQQRFPVWKKRHKKHHSQQRVAIENAFRLLKQRFRGLYLVDDNSIKQCSRIVMAAYVLHSGR